MENKLIDVIDKIKTPLALSGLIIIVLYYIYRQILSLNIFSEIGESNTFLLLDKTIGILFYLAILSIILGTIGYLSSLFIKPESGQEKVIRKPAHLVFSKVEISNSVEREGKGHHSSAFQHKGVYTLNFLLSNSGDNILVVKKVNLIILKCKKHEPKFDGSITIEAGPLRVFTIDAQKLTHKTPKYTLQNRLIEIEPNQVVGYETKFSSDEHFFFTVMLSFEWIDAITAKTEVSFSDKIELDFPYYNRFGRQISEIGK